MAGCHPFVLKYAKPVTSGIDSVYHAVEETGILSQFISELRKTDIGIQLKSLPPVTFERLHELQKPFQAKFTLDVSKQLKFTKGSITITLHICPELLAYVAVTQNPRRRVAQILGASTKPNGPCGTHSLFKFLKDSELIRKEAEAYQPPFYGMLDFAEAYGMLSRILEHDVSLELINRHPSEEEVVGNHVTTVYFDTFNHIELINLSDEVYIISLYIRYTEREKYDFLLKRPYGFVLYEPAFSPPHEVFQELLESINL